MSQPILFLVDDRPRVLEALAGDLERRFGADHRIVTEASDALIKLALRLPKHRDVVLGTMTAMIRDILGQHLDR